MELINYVTFGSLVALLISGISIRLKQRKGKSNDITIEAISITLGGVLLVSSLMV